MEFRHEYVMPNEHLPFRMFLFEGKDGDYKVNKHWHQSIEIFLVQTGQITFYINSQQFVISSGDYIIVNSNEIHSIDAPDQNEVIVIQIPLQAFEGVFPDEQLLNFMKQHQEQNERLLHIIERMYTAYEAKDEGYLFYVKSCFYELMYLLCKEFKTGQIAESLLLQKRQLHRLSNITAYMKQHYQEDITLTQVAAIFGFSPTYLSRIFQRYAQQSFQTYLFDIRVLHAARELLNSKHSINEIAITHGFCDSRAFSKAFGKRYGCLPSEYRKMKESTSK